MRVLAAALICTSCATAPALVLSEPEPQHASKEEILQSGGELTLLVPPSATVELGEAELVVWGMTEVPGNSRLQAALAMVDAIARAELVKYIRTDVTTLELDAQRGDSQFVAQLSTEVAQGLLPRLPLPRHAWHKIRRGDETILRLYARLSVERAVLAEAIREALARSGAPK